MSTKTTCLDVFARCVAAIRSNKLIGRESRQDKEFHFQNWFKARLSETEKLIVGYTFELRKNTLQPELADNPDAGKEHHFRAYRLKDSPTDEVTLRPAPVPEVTQEEDDDAE
jgi:hypothetical protein